MTLPGKRLSVYDSAQYAVCDKLLTTYSRFYYTDDDDDDLYRDSWYRTGHTRSQETSSEHRNNALYLKQH